ncbi:MAG: ChbG/HpnK family deacetylase [Parcubacteria group bacterium]|nr:ChbG/HpnK family deacetylase [Parcubacteria group bacterium]
MYSKKMQKRLIVSADDFGLDESINRGVIESFKNGIVTNTSILACGKAFGEAAELAKGYKELGVGIHLAINEETPTLPKDRIRSLIDEKTGSFLNYPIFLKRFLARKICLNEIYSEFESQIEKFVKKGLKPTHIDGHKHVHLIPRVFEILLELSKKFNIRGVRLSRVRPTRVLAGKKNLRALSVLGLSTIAYLQSRKIRRYNMYAPDYCYGLVESGHLDEHRLMNMLNYIAVGTQELICHPGFATDELANKYKWNYQWEKELEALTSSEIKLNIDRLGIRLIRYDEI